MALVGSTLDWPLRLPAAAAAALPLPDLLQDCRGCKLARLGCTPATSDCTLVTSGCSSKESKQQKVHSLLFFALDELVYLHWMNQRTLEIDSTQQLTQHHLSLKTSWQ